METQKINETWPNQKVSRSAFIWTIISIIGFVALFVSVIFVKKIPEFRYLSCYSSVLCHLALLPVVASLPAPAWAKVGGYTWAIFDSILAVATLQGVPLEVIIPFRLGLHTALAVWPLGVALTQQGFLRIAAIGLATTFGVIPLLGDLVPAGTMIIGMPFIFIWLGAIAWQFHKFSKTH